MVKTLERSEAFPCFEPLLFLCSSEAEDDDGDEEEEEATAVARDDDDGGGSDAPLSGKLVIT